MRGLRRPVSRHGALPAAIRGAVLAACLAGAPALAGPPYVTDDPEPTNRGKWEIYGFGSGTVSAHAREGQGGFDLNYGGAENLQLSAVVSLAYSKQPGGSSHIGVSDTEIGAKYRFLHQREGSWMPDVGLFPKIVLPSAGRHFGSGRVGFSVPLWMQKDFGRWSAFGGGGWTYNPGAGGRNYGFGGFALTRAVSKAISVGGEIYHQTADATDTRASTGVGLGATWQVAPTWSIIGSGGPLIQHRSAIRDYAIYLALEFHN